MMRENSRNYCSPLEKVILVVSDMISKHPVHQQLVNVEASLKRDILRREESKVLNLNNDILDWISQVAGAKCKIFRKRAF